MDFNNVDRCFKGEKNQSYYFIILSVVLTIVPGFCLQHGSDQVILLNITMVTLIKHILAGVNDHSICQAFITIWAWEVDSCGREGGWVGVCWSMIKLSLSVWRIWCFNTWQPLNLMGVTGADAPSINSRDGDVTPLCCSPLGQWQLLQSHQAAKVLCVWVCVSVLQVSMGIPDGGFTVVILWGHIGDSITETLSHTHPHTHKWSTDC